MLRVSAIERVMRMRAALGIDPIGSACSERQPHGSPQAHSAIDALCEIVRSAGATMTLYGRPIEADALRSFALQSALGRLRVPAVVRVALATSRRGAN